MDDNDKIRRNLVVFSSSVLYASFVGVSVKEKTISLFTDSIKISIPDNSVLWLGALTLVAYFFFRLIQSDEFKKDWTQAKTDFYIFRFNSILKIIERQMLAGNPESFLDISPTPPAPGNGLSINQFSTLIFDNKKSIKKIKVDSVFSSADRTKSVSIRIMLIFEFPEYIDKANTKQTILNDFPGIREFQDFEQIYTKKGDFLLEIAFINDRNIFFRLSDSKMAILNSISIYELICKTKFGTVYFIPFMATAVAAPACAARLTLTYFG